MKAERSRAPGRPPRSPDCYIAKYACGKRVEYPLEDDPLAECRGCGAGIDAEWRVYEPYAPSEIEVFRSGGSTTCGARFGAIRDLDVPIRTRVVYTANGAFRRFIRLIDRIHTTAEREERADRPPSDPDSR